MFWPKIQILSKLRTLSVEVCIRTGVSNKTAWTRFFTMLVRESSPSTKPIAQPSRCYNLHNGRDGYKEVDIIPWTQLGLSVKKPKDCLVLGPKKTISKWVDSHRTEWKHEAWSWYQKLILQTSKHPHQKKYIHVLYIYIHTLYIQQKNGGEYFCSSYPWAKLQRW